MNRFRLHTATFLMLLAMLAMPVGAGARTVDCELDTDSVSGLKASYNADEGCYTLTIESGDVQYIQSKALSGDLDSDLTYITFEYQSSEASNHLQVWYGPTWNKDKATVYGELENKLDWTTLTLNIKNDRKLYSWGADGGMIRLAFYFTANSQTVKIRNLKFSDGNMANKEVSLSKGGSVFVEAEDYNKGGLDEGYSSTEYRLDMPKYKNPAGNHMPIFGWISSFGIDQYRDMADAGFNIAFGNVSTDSELKGQLENAAKVGMKFLPRYWKIENSTDEATIKSIVKNYNDNEALLGWALKDEPYCSHFPTLARQQQYIRSVLDTNKLTYLNLLHATSETNYSIMGCDNYTDYVRRAITEVKTGFLAFDFYGIQVNSDNTWSLRDYYWESFEVLRRVTMQYGIPFWSYISSMGGSANNVTFPNPTEESMRFATFVSLAYGAQGICYYVYANIDAPYDVYGAPLEIDTSTWGWKKTAAYDYAKTVNSEIHALEPVFLGCTVTDVAHTGAKLPDYTRALGTLPAHFKSIENGDAGLLVSQITNGDYKYLFMMSHDVNNSQDVTVNLNSTDGLEIVKPDGTREAVTELTYKATLKVGDYLIFSWKNDDATVTEAKTPTAAQGSYRTDDEGVLMVEGDKYSNNYAIYNMGDDDWKHYNYGIYTNYSTRKITKANAQKNWGSYFDYDISVAEDMTADISIKRQISWDRYGVMAGEGLAPGGDYVISNATGVNWPKGYAASMILLLDGKKVKPAQTLRPVAPATYEADAATFKALLADSTKWTSTLVKGKTQNDTLWLWPEKFGAEDTVACFGAGGPEYKSVKLTKGLHTLRVFSLCSPWNFDGMEIADSEIVGIKPTTLARGQKPAKGGKGAITIESGAQVSVYSTDGTLMTRNVTGLISLPAGIYIIKGNGVSQKVIVK